MPLTMTTSAIADTQAIDAADVLTPLNQIKTFVDTLETSIATNASAITTNASAITTANTNRASADTAIVDGVTALNQINMGTAGTTLTIASDALVITKSRHQIDTQGAAATDDLSTITGFVAGDLLFLQTTSAARIVTIKHNVGNIFIFTGIDIVLDSPSKIAVLIYDGVTAKWCSAGNAPSTPLFKEQLVTTQVEAPLLSVPDRSLVQAGYGAPRLDFVPGITTSNRVTVRGSGLTIQADLAAITVTGTVSASNQSDSSYSNLLSSAGLASTAGFVSTFDLLQRRYNPVMECSVRSPSTFPAARWFIGLMAIAPGNFDDPAGAFIGLRYSTVLGDSGWKICMDDGTTLTVHGVDLTTYAADTAYLFRIRVEGSGGGVAYFSFNNSAEIAVTAGMVGSASNLGFGCIAYTNAAVSKNILFRSAAAMWA